MLKKHSPRFTIAVALSTVRLYCSKDLYISDVLYLRKLLNSVEMTKQLQAMNWGDVIRLVFSDVDGHFSALFITEEFREAGVTIKRHEPLDAAPHTFEAWGTISDAWFEPGQDGMEFHVDVTLKGPIPLQGEFPGKDYSIDDWSGLWCRFNMVASADSFLYVDLQGVTDYVVQAGDVLEYDIHLQDSLPKIGIDLICSDVSALRSSGAVDQNGLSCNPQTDIDAHAYRQWYHRSIALPAGWTGKTIQYFDIACENDALGAYEAIVANIRITDGAGTTRKNIWSRGDPLPTLADHGISPAGCRSLIRVVTGPAEHAGRTYPVPLGHAKKINAVFAAEDLSSYALRAIFRMVTDANSYLYVDLSSVTDYVIQSGDYLEYDLYWADSSAQIAVDYTCQDATTFRAAMVNDQNGVSWLGDDAHALNRWYARKFALPLGHVGKTIQYFDVACERNDAGSYLGLLRDIRITDGAGTIRKAIWMQGDVMPTFTVHLENPASVNAYDIDLAKSFVWILGRGGQVEGANLTKETTAVAYRDKRIVDSREYELFDGSQPKPYNGYSFVRFWAEQRSDSGSLWDMTFDLRGLLMGGAAAERNGINWIKWILTELAITVNAASFAAAAAALAGIYFDAVLQDKRKAQDIISELRWLCRAYLSKNESGEVTIGVDTYQDTPVAVFDESGDLGPKILNVNYYRKTAVAAAWKTYQIAFGRNAWTGEYAYKTQKRDVLAFGEEKTAETDYLRDSGSADRTACYDTALQLYGDEQLGITVGMDGRNLMEGNRITGIIPRLKLNKDWHIRSITRRLDEFYLELIAYSQSIYQYAAGLLPSEASGDDQPDYSNTEPASPTGLAITWGAPRQATDGGTLIGVTVSAVLPSVNAASMIIGCCKNGETVPYSHQPAALSFGRTWQGTIDGLVPGIAYDFIAIAVNVYSKSSAPALLSNQAAPGDLTAPAAPTVLTATTKIDGIELNWTAPAAADLAGYDVYRGIAVNPTVLLCSIGRLTKWKDTSAGMSTTYHYRLKSRDISGNASGYSSDVSAAGSQVSGAAGSGHISSGSVYTPDLASNAATVLGSSYTEGASTVSGSGVTVQSLAVVATGSPIYLVWGVQVANATASGWTQFYVEFYRDATRIQATDYFDIDSYAAGHIGNMSLCLPMMDTPSAGSHTYYLKVSKSGSYNLTAKCRSINALEGKR